MTNLTYNGTAGGPAHHLWYAFWCISIAHGGETGTLWALKKALCSPKFIYSLYGQLPLPMAACCSWLTLCAKVDIACARGFSLQKSGTICMTKAWYSTTKAWRRAGNRERGREAFLSPPPQHHNLTEEAEREGEREQGRGTTIEQINSCPYTQTWMKKPKTFFPGCLCLSCLYYWRCLGLW